MKFVSKFLLFLAVVAVVVGGPDRGYAHAHAHADAEGRKDVLLIINSFNLNWFVCLFYHYTHCF